MSSPSSLIPQGALTPPGGGGSSNIRVIVIGVIVVHTVFLGGLLFQGCTKKDDEKSAASEAEPTNSSRLAFPPPSASNSLFINEVAALPPPTAATSSLPTNIAYNGGTGIGTGSSAAAPETSSRPTPEPVAAGPAEIKEYTIVAGDNMYNIAKKEGVALNDLVKLNPAIDPRKMRPGMKLLIPPPKPRAAAAPEAAQPAGGGLTYVVKPNDNLSKIASAHGVTVKDLRAANNLRTTQIFINQKLVIPQKAASAGAPPPSAATPNGSTP